MAFSLHTVLKLINDWNLEYVHSLSANFIGLLKVKMLLFWRRYWDIYLVHTCVFFGASPISNLFCMVHYKFSFFFLVDEVTKIPKCYVIVYLLFYISKFSSCPSSLAKCKNGRNGNANHATYFSYFGSFDEKTNLPKWHEISTNDR